MSERNTNRIVAWFCFLVAGLCLFLTVGCTKEACKDCPEPFIIDGDLDRDPDREADGTENEASDGTEDETGDTDIERAEVAFIDLASNSFVHDPNFSVDNVAAEVFRFYVSRLKPFTIQNVAVTNRQFKEITNYTPTPRGYDSCVDRSPDMPEAAVLTSFVQAAVFLNALSEKEGYPPCYVCQACSGNENVCPYGSYDWENGLECEFDPQWPFPKDCPGYRLPSPLEWEYAARSGALGSLPCKDDPRYGFCGEDDFADLAELGHVEDPESCMWPYNVGTMPPNAFGLYDTIGNSREITLVGMKDPDKYGAHMEAIDDDFEYREERLDDYCIHRKNCSTTASNVHYHQCLFYEFEPGVFHNIRDFAFRPARTLFTENSGLTPASSYTSEKSMEAARPSPVSCQEANRQEFATPTLSFINPFPGPYYIQPMAWLRNGLWFGSWAGNQVWPSQLAGGHQPNWGETVAGPPVEAWGGVWAGNNQGAILAAHTDSEKTWPAVTEMTGSLPKTLVYDSVGDRILGWENFHLFVREAGGASHVFHYNVYKPVGASGRFEQVGELDGVYILGKGSLVLYKNDVLLFDFIVRGMAEDDLRFSAGLFKLEGRDWRLLAEFGEDRFAPYANSDEAYLFRGIPMEFQGKLILPSIPGTLWQWDGENAKIVLQDERIEPYRAEPYLAATSSELFLAANGDVFRIEENQLVQDLDFEDPVRLFGLASGNGEKIYVGGAKVVHQGDNIVKSFLSVRNGDAWTSLDKHIYGKAFPPPLTTVSIGENGKGLAGGYQYGDKPHFGPVLRFDGMSWYPWTESDYPVVGTYTKDGETAWFATQAGIYRISDEEGVVRERIPHSKGRYIFRLTGHGDEIYAIGEWGLLWKRGESGWVELPIDSTSFIFDGFFEANEAVLVMDDDWAEAGRYLYVLDLDSRELTPWPAPAIAEGYEKNINSTSVGMNEWHYHLQRSHLVRDRDGRVWLGRGDGVWVADRIGSAWTQVLAAFPLNRYRITDLEICGDGVCRVGIGDWTGYEKYSWMDIIRPGQGDGWEVIRRPLVYVPKRYGVFDTEATPDGGMVLVGGDGLIMEYGTSATIPCDLPISVETHAPYPTLVDTEALYGSCQSSFLEEEPNCADGACAIPAEEYCIGATVEGDRYGYAQADDYPVSKRTISGFAIDENPVTRREYAEFLNLFPLETQQKYVAFAIGSLEEALYELSSDGGSLQLLSREDEVLDFATRAGAETYCESFGKRLCSAEEWEAACRGFDDDPFPEGIYVSLQEERAVSDFGVRNLGRWHFEIVSDAYSHDSLRETPVVSEEESTVMLKGGVNEVEATCWSRSDGYRVKHPRKIAFRCCR